MNPVFKNYVRMIANCIIKLYRHILNNQLLRKKMNNIQEADGTQLG